MSTLDPRSAVFLEEMGIAPLWTLRGAAQAPPQDAVAPGTDVAGAVVVSAAAAAPAAAPVAAALPAVVPPRPVLPAQGMPSPEPMPPVHEVDSAWGEQPAAPPATDEEIAVMDWSALKNAIASCTRCGLCKGGRRPVYGNGAQQAAWVVAAGASTAADERERAPVAGEPGRLLANMLAAVGHSRESTVYVTNLIKCRPTSASGGERAPTAKEAQACKPYLAREVALSGARLVLTLGQIAANALQDKPLAEPLAGSRGAAIELRGANLDGVSMVATLHPGELLRRGTDKALAWADLCLAKAHDGHDG